MVDDLIDERWPRREGEHGRPLTPKLTLRLHGGVVLAPGDVDALERLLSAVNAHYLKVGFLQNDPEAQLIANFAIVGLEIIGRPAR